MKPKHVAALAALGLAGLLGLVLLWRTSQAAGETDPETQADDPATGARDPSQRPRPQLPGTAEVAGELPSILDVDIDAGARGPRVYVREDGVLIRDHRARATMMSSTELVRPKTGTAKMEPTTIVAVRNAMRPIVFRCAEAIPAASMGEDPRLQGEVMVSIAEGNLRVDDAVMKLADVEESAAAPMRDCVVQGVRDIHLAAPEAADVTRTILTLPFRLRR
jgi:hypothetical protein